MEKVAYDMGQWVRHARESLGYEKVILVGWSGGGSLSLFYAAQSEHPTITHTPAGDLYDLTAARLQRVDGIVFIAAHLSRAEVLTEGLTPPSSTNSTRTRAISNSISIVRTARTNHHSPLTSSPPSARGSGPAIAELPPGPRKCLPRSVVATTAKPNAPSSRTARCATCAGLIRRSTPMDARRGHPILAIHAR